MQERVFFTDQVGFSKIETKDGEDYFVEGYVSTSDKDLYNDIVTHAAMEDMVVQLKSKKIKLDVEHTSWRGGSPNIIPVGIIEDARIDKKGLFIRAKLNKHVSDFKNIWNMVKDGFLDAFSIAYKAIEVIPRIVGNQTVRLLNKIELLNVAMTGNPVNPGCRMTAVFMKSIGDFSDEPVQVEEGVQGDIMTEENAAPAPAPENQSAPEPASADAEVKSIIDSLKAEIAANKAELAELKGYTDRLDALEKKLSELVMKGRVDSVPTEAPAKPVKALDMIR